MRTTLAFRNSPSLGKCTSSFWMPFAFVSFAICHLLLFCPADIYNRARLRPAIPPSDEIRKTNSTEVGPPKTLIPLEPLFIRVPPIGHHVDFTGSPLDNGATAVA